MKTAQIMKQYLVFSRGEQRGIFILVFIILSINMYRFFLPAYKNLDPEDYSLFRRETEDFEQALAQARNQPREWPAKPKNREYSLPFSQRDTAPAAGTTPAPSFILDLNNADTLDLQRLRGIGPSYARRITGYRERLGGFTSVDQLLEVYGMDSARFRGIKPYLTVDPTGIRKMNLNAITFKELIAHPYMPYELAKEIALYRKKHKEIRTLDEIRGLKSFDSVTCERLSSYIDF